MRRTAKFPQQHLAEWPQVGRGQGACMDRAGMGLVEARAQSFVCPNEFGTQIHGKRDDQTLRIGLEFEAVHEPRRHDQGGGRCQL